ncbi:MAG: MFS transporter [Anaerolineae bacterium]|jgi:DHA1 family multidrug resistance protein-like MFS transporter
MSPTWKRSLWATWFAEFTSIVGFAIVIPILPLYIPELGVTDPKAVTFWSGLIFSAQAITMALMAPIWGTVADRYGRKLMVERAMFGGALVIGLMGFARSVQQLVLLRALQGILTGTVTAATALVAGTAPRERSGYALGILQMGIYLGVSVGPLLGGLIADMVSFRAAFWTTSALLVSGGILIALLVREDFEPPPTPTDTGWRALRSGIRAVLASRPLLSALGIRLMMRMGSRLLGPILPLFVQDLPLIAGAGFLSFFIQGGGSRAGLVQSSSAAAGALGAILVGRASDRIGQRQVLIVCALASALLYAPQFFVTEMAQLLLLQIGAGFAMGGVLAALSATLATFAPEGRQGAVYGLDASAVSGANAVAPMVGTALAVAKGTRAPFLGAAALFALGGLVTARLLPHDRERPPSEMEVRSPGGREEPA